MLGQRLHCLLYLLGQGQQLLTKRREPVAAGVPLHQGLLKGALQLDQPALHGGLVDTQRTSCGGCALVARHGQQVFQVVPVEHGRRPV